jgi:predicted DNA-binding transcriptional regulator AlpA
MNQPADPGSSSATSIAEVAAVVRAQSSRPSDLDQLPLLIPIPQVAKLLGISRSAAYRCAASGDLPTTHLGGRVYIVTAKLRALLEAARMEASAAARTASGNTGLMPALTR